MNEEHAKTYYDSLIHCMPNCTPNPTVSAQRRLFQGVNLGQMQWTNMHIAGALPTHRLTFEARAMSCAIIIHDLEDSKWYAEDLKEMLCASLFLSLMHQDRRVFESPARNILWQRTENKDGSLGVALPRLWDKPLVMPPRAEFHVVADICGPMSEKTQHLLNGGGKSTPFRMVQVQLHGWHELSDEARQGDDAFTVDYASGLSGFGFDSTTHGVTQSSESCPALLSDPTPGDCYTCTCTHLCTDRRKRTGV